jgi:hypothetical protein
MTEKEGHWARCITKFFRRKRKRKR